MRENKLCQLEEKNQKKFLTSENVREKNQKNVLIEHQKTKWENKQRKQQKTKDGIFFLLKRIQIA